MNVIIINTGNEYHYLPFYYEIFYAILHQVNSIKPTLKNKIIGLVYMYIVRISLKKINKIMFKKFTITDKLLFISAFLSLIFSEILYFQGEDHAAIFIGIWVPSILAFGIYLKLINNQKND